MLQSRVNSYEMIHLHLHYVNMCHQGQRHHPEEQILLHWQLWICEELCTTEQEYWCFCRRRTCCPYDWLLSLIIFTVSDFHLCWELSWVSTDICVKSGLMLVFVEPVPYVVVTYILWRESLCPCKSWTLGCCITYYRIKTIEENFTVHINN